MPVCERHNRPMHLIPFRPGGPRCDACDQEQALAREIAVHNRTCPVCSGKHPYVGCLFKASLAVREYSAKLARGEVKPSEWQPWPLTAVREGVLGGIPHAETLPSPPGAVAAMPTPAASYSQLRDLHPGREKTPQQIIIRDMADIQHLAGTQPTPTVKETTVVSEPARLTKEKGVK